MQGEDHDHEEGEEHDHDHDHDEEEGPEYDEHVWLSLNNSQLFISEICDKVSRLDKDNASYYIIDTGEEGGLVHVNGNLREGRGTVGGVPLLKEDIR